jgi:structure-specific recognition protein 1
MKLHGKSNDYKVLYSNIASLYLLPKPDGYHMALSLQLEHPLRQGATTYPHIVLQLPRDAPLEVEIALTEAECTARFGEKLDKFESGDMPSVVAKVLCAFTKRKVSGIRSGGFNADSGDERSKSIRCSLRAAEGFLYPLDKAFYFLSNKPVLIELDRVASVEFNRVDKSASTAAARTFDITVHVKDMSSNMQFVNLQRSEYKELYRFLTAKKLRIKNIASSAFAEGGGRGGDDDDDDDPYMARVRKEREAAQAQEAMDDDDDDDDDDSEDEDFVGGSGSDVDEEYDEGDDDDDESAFKGKKKGKKDKGPKKRKAESDSDSGSGSGSDGGDSDGSDEAKPLKKKDKKPLGIMAGGKKGKEKAPAKKKQKKDPNAPKKAQSAYMIWMNTQGRNQAKAENPDLKSIGDIGKQCGLMWKEMGAETKATWEAKAKEDKGRYDKEMAEYKGAASSSKGGGGSDSSSDDDAPMKEEPTPAKGDDSSDSD